MGYADDVNKTREELAKLGPAAVEVEFPRFRRHGV